jgi:hypothetical protein
MPLNGVKPEVLFKDNIFYVKWLRCSETTGLSP